MTAISQGQNSCGTSCAASVEKAIFAGGCFWCMEPPFEQLDGVLEVRAGYTGGDAAKSSYEQVSGGRTGHYEVVQVVYDPARVTYDQLLEVFWRNIDPTDGGGQFADRGSQYKTAVFYTTPAQKTAAEASRRALAESKKFDRPIATEIRQSSEFYPAEEYHQDYYKKNAEHYKRYKSGSGRQGFIERAWGGDTKSRTVGQPENKTKSLRSRLTPLQYHVTQEAGTERPFDNEYWDNHSDGIYVDIVSGEALFSSRDKFESGTGWPSFTKPVAPKNVVERTDKTHGMARIEVRSTGANSHLGHVFNDGPAPEGIRYCINSASLRFIPLEQMASEGYSELIGEVRGAKSSAVAKP